MLSCTLLSFEYYEQVILQNACPLWLTYFLTVALFVSATCSLKIFKIVFIYLCVCTCAHARMCTQAHICHDTNMKIRFSTSITRVLGIERRSLGMAASLFSHRVFSLAPYNYIPTTHLWHKCYKCTRVCPFSKSLQPISWLVAVTLLGWGHCAPEPYSKCWAIVSGVVWCLVQIPNSIYYHFPSSWNISFVTSFVGNIFCTRVSGCFCGNAVISHFLLGWFNFGLSAWLGVMWTKR